MNKLKLGVVSLLSALAGFPVLAQEAASNWDFDFVGDAATDMATQFKTVMTGDVATAIYTILGILVGFYLLLKLPRIVGLGKK